MQKFSLSVLFLASLFSHQLSAQVDESKDSDIVKFNYSLIDDGDGSNSTGLRLNYHSGSIGGDNFGEGLKIHYATPAEAKSDLIECAQNDVGPIAPQATALGTVALSATCSQIKEDDVNLYTVENCELLNSCSKRQLSKDSSMILSYLSLQRMIAEDYAGLMMEDYLPKMERLETLRNFAAKKFGKGFGSCKPMFDWKDSEELSRSCDKDIIEDGFKSFNGSCSVTNLGCYNLGADYGKNISEKESAIGAFFQHRTEAKVTESLSADNEFLESLSQIISSKDKSEDKLLAIFKKLKELKSENKLDPVFSYDLDGLYTEAKLSPHFAFFKKIVSKPQTIAAAKSAVEKYRRDYTSKIFKKDCSTSLTYVDICKKAKEVSKGRGALYMERFKAASRLKDSNKVQFETLKMLYPNGITSDKDAFIVLNAKRCIALGVVSTSASDIGLNSPYGLGNLNGGSEFLLGRKPALAWDIDFSGSSSSGPDNSDVKRNKDDLSINTTDKSALAGAGLVTTSKSDADIAETQNEQKLSESFSENLTNAGSTINSQAMGNQNFQSPSYNTINNGLTLPEQPVIDLPVGESKKSVSSPQDSLNDKIAELTKKLSATEENLAKMKEERVEEEEKLAADKKREEELQTIADLKKQINDLKAEAAKPAPEIKNNKPENESTPTRSFASTRAPAIVVSDAEESGGNSHAVAETKARVASSVSTSPSSGGEIAARTPAGASAISSGSKPVLTLTKADGMSAEKFSETISNKIFELGGQSFEIEENGVKIEIVPEMKNGKILLDAKGMPRFIKKVKSAKTAKAGKSRVPASITDKADLHRLDEEAAKRERAEYLKLKNITNQAVQKK